MADSEPKHIVVAGAGEIAELAHRYFSADTDYEIAGFAVDRAFLQADTFLGRPLVAFEAVTDHFPPDRYLMFAAFSYTKLNRLRAEKYEAGKRLGYRFATYVSPRCTYLSEHPPGENCFIFEDNTIQPHVRIGDNVILWSGNHIGHEAVIEDHCFISSHVVVSGHAVVGAYSFLGVNCTLRNGIRIGRRNIIGMGAVIAKSTEDDAVYVAPPALKLDKSSSDVEL